MKLYGHPDSGHAFKVKFCLDSAAIEHQYQKVNIFAERATRPAEFVSRSRFCEVPLLVDEGHSLIQSNAILVYIARKQGIYGAQTDVTLQSCLEWLVWEANRIGMCLPQLRADKKFPGSELNAGAREWLLDRYLHDVGVLQSQLGDGRSFILGEELTIADFSLCGYLMYADEAEVAVPDKVAAWITRLRNLDGWGDPYKILNTEAQDE